MDLDTIHDIVSREASTAESLAEAEASIAGLRALDSALVTPVVTPR